MAMVGSVYRGGHAYAAWIQEGQGHRTQYPYPSSIDMALIRNGAH